MDGCSQPVTVLTGDTPTNQNSFFAPSVYTLTDVDSQPLVGGQRRRSPVLLRLAWPHCVRVRVACAPCGQGSHTCQSLPGGEAVA